MMIETLSVGMDVIVLARFRIVGCVAIMDV